MSKVQEQQNKKDCPASDSLSSQLVGQIASEEEGDPILDLGHRAGLGRCSTLLLLKRCDHLVKLTP